MGCVLRTMIMFDVNISIGMLYPTGVSCVSEEGRLNAIAGRQPLFQLWGELLTELLPVLLSNLVLKAMQDLQQITAT